MNTKVSPLYLANQLIASAAPGGSIFDNNPDVFRVFGVGNGLHIKKANAAVYTTSLQHLYEFDKDIRNSYSLQHFEKSVLGLIHPHVVEGTQTSQRDVQAFLQRLASAPLEKHYVYRPIYGISFEGSLPVTLGPYTVFATQAHAAELAADMAGRAAALELASPPPYLIRVSAPARENVKALEIADAQFETFEHVIRFMIGLSQSYEVGVLNYRGTTQRQAIMLSNEWG